MKLTHLDLFAGLGAFSLGFERQGFEMLAQVEVDKNCRKLLDAKWPKVLKHDDVTTFDPDSIKCPSVVTFGSPCQDLSVAGQRAGMAGERSGLFYHATRIIQRLVGRGLEFALWENVPGAFSSNGGRDFAGVLAELGRCGALDIGYRVLDCQFWGLPQRRRRIFLVADFRAQRCAQILSFESCLRGHPQTSREAGQRVAPTVAGCSNGGGANGPGRDVDSCESLIPSVAAPCGHHHRRDDLDNDTYIPVVARAVTAERDGYNDGSDQTYICMAHGQANAERVSNGSPSLSCNHEAPIVIGFGGKDHGQDALKDCSPTLRSGNHVESNANGGCGPAVAFQPRYFTRDNKTGGAPSDTVDITNARKAGDSAPHITQGFGVRRLTPKECERLQGLPDNWTENFSDSVRYRMIGNSAAVPVIEWLAKAMREALK